MVENQGNQIVVAWLVNLFLLYSNIYGFKTLHKSENNFHNCQEYNAQKSCLFICTLHIVKFRKWYCM